MSPKDPKVSSLGSRISYPPKAVGDGVSVLLGIGVFDGVMV
jgi:hypothetical protein